MTQDMRREEMVAMGAMPALPNSGTLVLVGGPHAGVSKRFETVEDLERWTPEFPVGHVQIFTNRQPFRPEARFITRNDGTTLRDIGEGRALAITTHRETQNPIQAALGAYRWAYQTAGEDTVDLSKHKR